jgi:CheY-like chemotaxis protein
VGDVFLRIFSPLLDLTIILIYPPPPPISTTGTPLHQVTGFIELLDQTNLTTEQKSYIKLLKASAQGLMTVISDVLDYSKLEAGKMKLEMIPYEPFSVVEGSMEVIRASCEEKGLKLTMDWNKNVPFKLLGDPNRLRQVLLNLLSNSVKFTNQGGIRVQALTVDRNAMERECEESSFSKSTASDSQMVKFIIHDTGAGIQEEHLGMIFNDYYQGNVSVARTHGGTGLGLSICKLLVSKMGGTIGVKSEYGKNSSFWFCLPADVPKEVDADAEEPTNTTPVAETFDQLKILVAEDNIVNQKLVKRILERLGHAPTIVENGKDAITMIEEYKNRDDCFDLVLMDIQMPVMDGLEATRRLRTMGYVNLPIFGLTASVARSDFRELGFDDWLPKPIPMKDLKMKLLNLQQHCRLPPLEENQ